MKISSALKSAKEKLNQAKIETANLDALLLLCHCLQATKEQIIFNPEKEINKIEEELFFQLISRRTLKEPISYIIGKKEFFGLDFFVDKNVLNPRPDSETLVELTLNLIINSHPIYNSHLEKNESRNKCGVTTESSPSPCHPALVAGSTIKNKNDEVKILEIGVGSGCLTISLLKNLDFITATAIDISENALKITEKNAVFHDIKNRLELIKSDLFTELKFGQRFDFIISNPPYICSEEILKLNDEVKLFEPYLALDGGKSGLEFYERIATQARNFLKENGKIILEIGFDQKSDVIEIFTKSGFFLIAAKPDLAGRDRVLCFK